MKQLILSLLIVFGITSMAYSQLELRPQLGVNSSTINDFGSVEFENQLGYQFGADLLIGGRLYFQPGLLFEVVKNEARFTTGPNTVETDLTVNRIKIPVMLGFRLIEGDSESDLNVRAFAGPNASFVVSKELDSEFTIFEEDDFEDVSWGLNFGAGLDFSILFLDVGYHIGLSDTFDLEEGDSKNNLFFANAGVRIRF